MWPKDDEAGQKKLLDTLKAKLEMLGEQGKGYLDKIDSVGPLLTALQDALDRIKTTLTAPNENIDTTKQRVERMMGTIVTAFEKQLDSLFGADALDISTDITVLETMMAREGLTGEKMEAKTTSNVDIPEIKLEL